MLVHLLFLPDSQAGSGFSCSVYWAVLATWLCSVGQKYDETEIYFSTGCNNKIFTCHIYLSKDHKVLVQLLNSVPRALNNQDKKPWCHDKGTSSVILRAQVTVIFADILKWLSIEKIDWSLSPVIFSHPLDYRSGAFFFLIINMVFGNLSAVELFIKERAIFMWVKDNSFEQLKH